MIWLLLRQWLTPILGVAAGLLLAGALALAWQNRGLRADLAEARLDLANAIVAADKQARAIEDEARTAKDYLIRRHRDEIATADARLDDALRRLRDQPRAGLRPAETAPAECREHACSPAQLPVRDAEFLVGHSGRADRVVLQLQACQRELEAVTEAVNRQR